MPTPRWSWPRRSRASLLRAASAAALMMVSGACRADGDEATVDRWVERSRVAVEAAEPDQEEMQIDPSADCELVDGIEIAGKPLELFGAGTARFGDVGVRYQCAWSGDVDSSANVRLEVVLVDRPDDYRSYAELVPTRAGNVTVATSLGDVEVASFTPEGASRPVTTSVLLVPGQRAGIHLVVELLDAEASASWTADDHARLLEALGS